jgi:pyruvate formate lyase activating enzyme
MKKGGIWIELTTLLIPDLNSDKGEISELISFILELDHNIPWHVSRFFPHHQMLEAVPTDINLIYEFLESAKNRGILYLYGGNIMSEKWTDTACPQCGSILISRVGYTTTLKNISLGSCTQCGNDIPGIWK